MNEEKYWRNILYPLKLSPKFGDNKLKTLHKQLCIIQNLDDIDDIPNVLNSKYAKIIKDKISLLHSYGIIHGDLHIDNIVIDDNDDILFIDFETTKYINNDSAPKKYHLDFKKASDFLELKLNGYDLTIDGLLKRELDMPFI